MTTGPATCPSSTSSRVGALASSESLTRGTPEATSHDVNGLREPCSIMVDKITTIPRSKLGAHVGRMSDEEMVRLGRAILVFLGVG